MGGRVAAGIVLYLAGAFSNSSVAGCYRIASLSHAFDNKNTGKEHVIKGNTRFADDSRYIFYVRH